MAKKKSDKVKPEVHEDLKGFTIKINEFGEVVTSHKIEELNEFLDENVEDKKLVNRQIEAKTSQEEE